MENQNVEDNESLFSKQDKNKDLKYDKGICHWHGFLGNARIHLCAFSTFFKGPMCNIEMDLLA